TVGLVLKLPVALNVWIADDIHRDVDAASCDRGPKLTDQLGFISDNLHDLLRLFADDFLGFVDDFFRLPHDFLPCLADEFPGLVDAIPEVTHCAHGFVTSKGWPRLATARTGSMVQVIALALRAPSTGARGFSTCERAAELPRRR